MQCVFAGISRSSHTHRALANFWLSEHNPFWICCCDLPWAQVIDPSLPKQMLCPLFTQRLHPI